MFCKKSNWIAVSAVTLVLLASGCAAPSKPKVSFVPINPPPGQVPNTYPTGTDVDSYGGEISFPSGTSMTNVWFELWLSNWGDKGLRRYQVNVASATACPTPPCDCMLSSAEASITCSGANPCPTGSSCRTNGTCTPAFIDTTHPHYIFAGMSTNATSGVVSPPNSYLYHGQLTGSFALPDDGQPHYVGTFAVMASDYCVYSTTTLEATTASSGTSIGLGDGSNVDAETRKGKIGFKPTSLP